MAIGMNEMQTYLFLCQIQIYFFLMKYIKSFRINSAQQDYNVFKINSAQQDFRMTSLFQTQRHPRRQREPPQPRPKGRHHLSMWRFLHTRCRQYHDVSPIIYNSYWWVLLTRQQMMFLYLFVTTYDVPDVIHHSNNIWRSSSYTFLWQCC